MFSFKRNDQLQTAISLKTKRMLMLSGLIFVTGLMNYSIAQVVNAYAKVTAISGKVLTVSDVNETYHTFNVGEKVIIMQMQDNVIGGTNDDTNFGTLGTIGSAGLYEVGQITAKTVSTITLNYSLTNSYNTGTNSSVQVISYRLAGNPDFTTLGDVVALPWDGNIGGVIAFKVDGILTLNHNVTANGVGFRGGAPSANDGTVDCNAVYRTSNSSLSGEKGEGIFKRTDVNQQYGRAKIINGGGGGNRHNAGGAGGGNATIGGDGGPGYACSGSPVGGQGGLSLNSYINISRIFMGGGGGGGHQNNNIGTPGTSGGGIILIKATQIITTGSCSGRLISADGLNASNPNNDGAGGAGAGGTIVLDVDSFTVLGSCSVSVSANGGNGGSSSDPSVHGGGGGGSQGKVFYSTAPPANVTTTTNNGSSGCNNNSNPCTDQAPAPSGSNGAGVATNAGSTPLPIQLVSFDVYYIEGKVVADWITESELNNNFFTLERSADGSHFETLLTVDGAGTTKVQMTYRAQDLKPLLGRSYYRLKQTDWDKREESLRVKSIRIDEIGEQLFTVELSPNPSSSGVIIISLSEKHDDVHVEIVNLSGQTLMKDCFNTVSETFEMELSESIIPGIYFIKVFSQGKVTVNKLVVAR